MKTTTALLLLLLTSCGVQQNLSNSFALNNGMSKAEVLNLMGKPIKSDFYKNVDEWHYCSTGRSDQFLSLFFHDGKLIAKNNYTVTINDTRGVIGSCQNFIKRGSYQVPDNVVEIRMIY